MDEKVRSSWSLKAAQAGIGQQAVTPLGLGVIAALPVLPAAFSSASAEPRRHAESGPLAHSLAPAEATFTTKPLGGAPVVKPIQGTPALASDAQALAQAPVRISDLASSSQVEKDAPACRTGDRASLDPGQIFPTPKSEEDRAGAERPGSQDVPLPHCIIEFDPDSDDGDVIAHAPSPQTVQVMAKSASAPALAALQRPASDKPQQGETSAATPPAQAEAAPPQSTEKAPAPASSPLSELSLVVTEATRGVGTAVIDPLLPLGSIVFGGEPPSGFGEEAAMLALPPPPDRVGDSLAAVGTGFQPELIAGLGNDLIFFT